MKHYFFKLCLLSYTLLSGWISSNLQANVPAIRGISPRLALMYKMAAQELRVKKPFALQAEVLPDSVGAETDGKNIYINTERSELLVGFDRVAAFHELTHIKNNDVLKVRFIELNQNVARFNFIMATVLYTLYYTCGLNVANELYVALSSYTAAHYSLFSLAHSFHLYFIERRADTTAFHAVQCEKCLQEASHFRPKTWNEKGYLSSQEIQEIAKIYKNQECYFHKNKFLFSYENHPSIITIKPD